MGRGLWLEPSQRGRHRTGAETAAEARGGSRGRARGVGGTTSSGVPAAYGGRLCHFFNRASACCPHTQFFWGEGTAVGL